MPMIKYILKEVKYIPLRVAWNIIHDIPSFLLKSIHKFEYSIIYECHG